MENDKKMDKRNIGDSFVDGVTQRNLLRLGAENRLIADSARWMDYHKARNATSHTYNEEAAENVFKEATEFVHDAKYLLKMLEARND